ncbi:MAG: hypothetical protein ACRDYU_04585 [Actinomycetes bacterium]
MTGVRSVGYRHLRTGFAVSLPEGWDHVDDPQPGVALVALEPDRGTGFRANLVVTVDEVPDGVDLAGWQAGCDELLARTLVDYLLLDLHTVSNERGPAAVHRLAHHLVNDAEAVTMAQWAVLRGRTGLTLTASAATLAYDSLADTFAAVAGGFRPDPCDGAAR